MLQNMKKNQETVWGQKQEIWANAHEMRESL